MFERIKFSRDPSRSRTKKASSKTYVNFSRGGVRRGEINTWNNYPKNTNGKLNL